MSHSTTNTPVPHAEVVRLAWGRKEVAAALGIGLATLERLLASGRFPKPDARAGRRLLWRPSTVEAWLAEGGAR